MIPIRFTVPVGKAECGYDLEFADDWFNHWDEAAKQAFLKTFWEGMTAITNERDRVGGPHIGKPGTEWPKQ